MLASVVITALAWLCVHLGWQVARRAWPGHAFFQTFERIPGLLFAIVLILLPITRSGFAVRPGWRGWRLFWPGLLVVGWMATLVAWRGRHDWPAVLTTEAVVAFWEECVFRGVILMLLLRRGRAWALWGSATLFALVHGAVLFEGLKPSAAAWGLLWPFSIGVLFGAIRLRTGSIWFGVLAHFVLNTFNDVAPRPLAWNLDFWPGLSTELLLLLIVNICWGTWICGWWRRTAMALSAAATVALLTLMISAGGPRAGWKGPGWDASFTLLTVVETRVGDEPGWYRYQYRLRCGGLQAEVVRCVMIVEGDPIEAEATAGTTSWKGTVNYDEVTWECGQAPETIYSFRSRLPAQGTVLYRFDYIDRFGSPRSWDGVLKGPG